MVSHRLLDEEEALEELDEVDKNKDGKVDWPEFLESHFSYSEDDIKNFRKQSDKETEDLLQVSTFLCLKLYMKID